MPLPDYLPGRFALARGRPSDYFALEHFHYLPRRPATYADVWVVTYADRTPHEATRLAAGSDSDPRPLRFFPQDAMEARWSTASRRDRDDARAPRSRRTPRQAASLHEAIREWTPSSCAPRVVAVGVLSFPTFRSRPRERELGLSAMSHRDRLAFANANVRTISRVVVHPQFRSLGLASELVRALIAACPTRYVEASAVMARVHPFFEAAGMRRVEDEGRKHEDEDDEKRESNDAAPVYFLVDKAEGSPCER